MLDKGPVFLISNCILWFMWVAVEQQVLTMRFRFRTTMALQFLLFVGFVVITNALPYATMTRFILGLLYIILPQMLLYRNRWYQTLSCMLLIETTMFLSELLLSSLLMGQEVTAKGVWTLSWWQQLSHFTVYLFCNAVLLWLLTMLLTRYKTGFSSREWLLYTLFPISQLFMLGIFAQMGVASTPLHRDVALPLAVGLNAVTDVALYFVVRGLSQRAELQARNQLLSKQIDEQNTHYSMLTAQYEDIRHMRHDIKHHLHTIRILLEQGRHDQAAAYAAEVQKRDAELSSLGICQNPVVDAFLCYRLRELQSQGIQPTVQVTLPADAGVANADLICALGNLLDNAAEACQHVPEKRLSLGARLSEGYVVVSTLNPLSDRPAEKKRRIPQLERGVGFHILNELAAKYHGAFVCSAEGQQFRAVLTLKGVDSHADRHL